MSERWGPGPDWQPPYRPPFRPPWIVGPAADRVLGFLVGLFANVLGFVGAVVVMFLWADNARDVQEHDERRAQARAVSTAAGIGCLLPFLLGLFFVLLAILSLGPHLGGARL